MKTLRLHAAHDLRFHEEPTPVPGSGDALLRVKAVGICGSDLHWYQEGGIGDACLVHPLVLGHEFTAVTEAGERVAVEPSIACGQCEYCQRGDPNLCENLIFAGHGNHDGALRQQIAWPRRCLFPISDRLSEAECVMLEPLGVAMHAVNLGKLRVGMNVGVFGVGPIGLLVLQLVRLSGAETIVVTDKLSHRLEAARSLGATNAILAGAETEVRGIMAATGGRGVDVAFEVAGENEAVETSIASVRPGGRVVLIGIPGDDRTSFSASTARRKGLTLILVRRMKHIYPDAIRLVESGQVDVRSLVTHTFQFEQAADAFALATRREGLKVVILL
jgi:L-iditol 2-dehydrogenase